MLQFYSIISQNLFLKKTDRYKEQLKNNKRIRTIFSFDHPSIENKIVATHILLSSYMRQEVTARS